VRQQQEPQLIEPLENNPVFCNSEKAELLLDFDEITSSTFKRVHDCHNQLWKITAKCLNCNREFVTLGHCFIRYCSNCVPSKISRAKKTLSDIMRNYPDVVSHLMLTIPRGSYSKDHKKYLENSKRKFMQNLRRKHIRFSYVSVVDYGNPKMIDDSLEVGLHIHAVVNVPYGFYLNPKFLQKLWAKSTGIPDAVVKIKKSRKSAIIKYFARRVAGQFGHQDNYVYFEEIMAIPQYDNLVRKSRTMSAFSDDYSCKRSAYLSRNCCQECGGELRILAIQYGISYVMTSQDWFPELSGVET
jgi:hypothetical protein